LKARLESEFGAADLAASSCLTIQLVLPQWAAEAAAIHLNLLDIQAFSAWHGLCCHAAEGPFGGCMFLRHDGPHALEPG